MQSIQIFARSYFVVRSTAICVFSLHHSVYFIRLHLFGVSDRTKYCSDWDLNFKNPLNNFKNCKTLHHVFRNCHPISAQNLSQLSMWKALKPLADVSITSTLGKAARKSPPNKKVASCIFSSFVYFSSSRRQFFFQFIFGDWEWRFDIGTCEWKNLPPLFGSTTFMT